MNNQEGLEFVRKYFDELFGKRNIDALDTFLDENYFDDDVGDPEINHLENSKAFLTELFKAQPTIGVDVNDAITLDNVITAYLNWFVVENNAKRIIRKGIAIFVMNNRKILKRHTFVYYQE